MKPPLPSRQARPASAGFNIAKTLLQTALFWGVFLFLVPPLIVWSERNLGIPRFHSGSAPIRTAAIALFIICGAGGLWSGCTMAVHGLGTPIPFDCPRHLVIAGPYRFIRNPMAVTGLGQGLAVALYLGSFGVLLYTLAGGFVWNFLVRRWEEFDLELRFGAEYESYRSSVKCWIPRLRPYRPPDAAPQRK